MSLAITSTKRDTRGGRPYADRKTGKRTPAPPANATATGSGLFADLSGGALAVFGAQPGTCRFVSGEGAAFRFCGAPATEIAAGQPAYCAPCSARMWPSRARLPSTQA